MGELFGAEVNPSALILTGPSHLPQLHHLHFIYENRLVLDEEEDVGLCFDGIFLHHINRTIEARNSFPALKTFDMVVRCLYGSFMLDTTTFSQELEGRLPAVFGTGGREETCGWAVSITGNIAHFDP